MTEKLMRKILVEKGRKTGFLFLPIETRGTSVGMADLIFAGCGNGGVIELKILKGKDRIFVPYRVGQRMFLTSHFKANPRTFVLGHYEGGYYLINGAERFPTEYKDLRTLIRGQCGRARILMVCSFPA